jgi:hypothetical protein
MTTQKILAALVIIASIYFLSRTNHHPGESNIDYSETCPRDLWMKKRSHGPNIITNQNKSFCVNMNYSNGNKKTHCWKNGKITNNPVTIDTPDGQEPIGLQLINFDEHPHLLVLAKNRKLFFHTGKRWVNVAMNMELCAICRDVDGVFWAVDCHTQQLIRTIDYLHWTI